ncbi:MAG: hypothetical protein PHW82_16390 [Bacteroidales bacterium]|nr:hypothetical protein [Bacteroidales bacterium]
MSQLDEKFNILDREAGIITGLLTSGLENLRKISNDESYYYLAFYSLSTGIERLLKLIIYIENPKVNLKSFNHQLTNLVNHVGVKVDKLSVEQKLLEFLDNFAKGDRYHILDYLSSQSNKKIIDEPIVKFYNSIFVEIISKHPPRKIMMSPQVDFASVLHTRENLTEITSFDDLFVHGQLVDRVAKYSVMYFGRLIQPLIERINSHSGLNNNPFYNEGFRYLYQPDSYFLNRKTFRQ